MRGIYGSGIRNKVALCFSVLVYFYKFLSHIKFSHLFIKMYLICEFVKNFKEGNFYEAERHES